MDTVITEAMVERAHERMMSELFLLCQPNRGDVFSFMDDRKDVMRGALKEADVGINSEALDLLSAVTQSDGKVDDLLWNQIQAFLRKVG